MNPEDTDTMETRGMSERSEKQLRMRGRSDTPELRGDEASADVSKFCDTGTPPGSFRESSETKRTELGFTLT